MSDKLKSEKIEFLLRKSTSIANAWVISYVKRGEVCSIPIRCEATGYLVDGLDDKRFGK